MELIYSHCLIRLNISRDNKHVGFNSLKKQTILQISVTSEQRSHSDPTASKKNSDHRAARSAIANISTATHWHRQWTLWDLIDRRLMVRTFSMLKTNSMAQRGNGILKEWSWVAVWSPEPRSKISYDTVRPPLAPIRVVVQTPWSSLVFAWLLYGVLWDVTARIFLCQNSGRIWTLSQLKIEQKLTIW